LERTRVYPHALTAASAEGFLESPEHSHSLYVIKTDEVKAMTLALTLIFAVNLYARASRSR
jgi:hypothetical protein